MRTQDWVKMVESSDLAMVLWMFWLVEFLIIIMQQPSHAETFQIIILTIIIVIMKVKTCGSVGSDTMCFLCYLGHRLKVSYRWAPFLPLPAPVTLHGHPGGELRLCAGHFGAARTPVYWLVRPHDYMYWMYISLLQNNNISSQGRVSRHQELSNVLDHSLTSANIPIPSVLYRADGNLQPDWVQDSQMGGSWCGMPPAWTPFGTPTIKHQGCGWSSGAYRGWESKVCPSGSSIPVPTNCSGNLWCSQSRLHVLSPQPRQEAKVSHRRAQLFHLPPPAGLCGNPGRQFDFSPRVSPRLWYLGSILMSTLLVLSFCVVSYC